MPEKLTAEQKIARAHYYILQSRQWLAYSSIIMVGKTEVVDDVLTAQTDGFNIKYGRAFIDALPEEAVRFVVLHENKHKMYRHFVMWQNLHRRDPGRMNQACDHVINLQIIAENDPGVVMPEPPYDGLADPQYANMDSGEVFRRLPPTPPCPLCALGIDHEGGNSNGSGTCSNPSGGFDEHDWGGANNISDEEQRSRAEQIDSAMRQGAMLAGKLAGNIPREFSELSKIEIDPEEIIRRFIQQNMRGRAYTTWRRPHRRWLAQGMNMPSYEDKSVHNPLIGIDTSGSIQGPDLNRLLTNALAVIKAANPKRLDMLYWDHAVAEHEIYDKGRVGHIATLTRPKGGGGTTPSCITDYINKNKLKPTLAIIFTDGWVGSDWGGDWPCPVLWVIKDNPTAKPTTGSAVYF